VGREGGLALGGLRVRRPAYKLTPDQLDAWRKAIAPTESEWAAQVTKAGGDPKAAMDALKAAVAKYKAGL